MSIVRERKNEGRDDIEGNVTKKIGPVENDREWL